jgi:hypothetical protein
MAQASSSSGAGSASNSGSSASYSGARCALGLDQAELSLARVLAVVLDRSELEALELHVVRRDLDRAELEVVADEHGLVLEHAVRQAEVALDLGHDATVAEELEVDVDAALVLRDVVREAPAPPELDLRELAVLASDDLLKALAHLVGALGVDVGAKDVDRFVLSGASGRRDHSTHAGIPLG